MNVECKCYLKNIGETKIEYDTIEKCPKCNKYLSPERSDWIGNDEAHYVRRQKDRDIIDMKKFIKAMVYFIGMTLITENAESMEAKK